MDPSLYRLGTRIGLIRFYKEQLIRFDKIGLGGYTEYNVMISPVLIEATQRRLDEIQISWNGTNYDTGE